MPKEKINGCEPRTFDETVADLRELFNLNDENLSYGSTEQNGEFFIDKRQLERWPVIEVLQAYFKDKFIEGHYLEVHPLTFVFTSFKILKRDEKFSEMIKTK